MKTQASTSSRVFDHYKHVVIAEDLEVRRLLNIGKCVLVALYRGLGLRFRCRRQFLTRGKRLRVGF